jgi:putative transcriptional regulator
MMRASQKRSRRPTAPKHSALGRQLIRGLQKVEAHLRGEIDLPSRELPVPGHVNIEAIRANLGLSQIEFARRYGLSPRSLQDWEQGKSKPDSAVRAYLTVIERNHEAVEQALRTA